MSAGPAAAARSLIMNVATAEPAPAACALAQCNVIAIDRTAH
jgi:hypothetical protein